MNRHPLSITSIYLRHWFHFIFIFLYICEFVWARVGDFRDHFMSRKCPFSVADKNPLILFPLLYYIENSCSSCISCWLSGISFLLLLSLKFTFNISPIPQSQFLVIHCNVQYVWWNDWSKTDTQQEEIVVQTREKHLKLEMP